MKHNYLRNSLVLVAVFLFSLSGFSQKGKGFWNETSLSKVKMKEQVLRKTMPAKAQFYTLNLDALKNELQHAPNRKTTFGPSPVIIDFPTANNTFESFRVKEASVMEKELQDKYPEIRTYIGESVDTPGTTMRFSITNQGLHTMSMSSNNGTQFIDPFSKDGASYIVYAKRDLPALDQVWECAVEGEDEAMDLDSNFDYNAYKNANDGKMREYRLAVATTIEYSAFHWQAAGLTAAATEAQKKAAVLAAVVVTINRNNQIYERDLSVTMTLVANNDAIIFINSDNFSNDNAGALINESQTVINSIIQSANYDIGHTFSTGGGGLAALGSVCSLNSKARGITGSPQPVGDAYDVDYVAHELGHQFGAPHTFNGNAGNCGGSNRSASNAYEPGSGSTIMAYAGICAPQNVQGNSDAYFHQKSLQMIFATINNSCANEITTGNTAPVANAGGDYIIPMSTPYKLTGASTDVDGTATHTYTWEQYDLGPAGLPTETTTLGPLVRSYPGTSETTRYIPRLEDIAISGGVSTTWEKLSSVQRDLKFRLTVRDNDVVGGQTAVDEMTASVTTAAGPFVVTSQDVTGISWTSGDTETITWDVANTTAAGINVSHVNILLSTNGGLSYDTVLASNVPNNGAYDVTVPSTVAPFCRVMVEAVGNIFFNVNSKNFSLNSAVTETCNLYESGPLGTAIPDGVATGTGQGQAIGDTINVSEASIIGSDTTIKVNVDITHPELSDLVVQLQHPGGAFISLWGFNCVGSSNFDITFAVGAPPVVCGDNITGTYSSSTGDLSTFNGLSAAGDWTLVMADFEVGNTGTFNDWSIELCTTTLGTDDFALENSFSIYPNPNNGEFNVKFKSESNNVTLELFDIRGRSIYTKGYNNSGAFNETINLGNVQSGMYLLNVNDGSRTFTKKIIVE
ncbi:reprolysin-like metallopeptidase [Bizionia paragorgiae]|uniref:zinc-dependent metalloprotease n=1 Tax=Bizionia paragorgiae TaxID=283786 RepID=UPI00299D34D9|nr:zinc-dependent metalloprotease family protein [Bizionia paragorgiae]MDX1270212.1 M12 family metallo-peptidase [Bizionia paragorgiae]